jgi:aerobic C4-dicarboxylate transport protein
MKNLFKNLTFWVLTAIVSGILLGHYRPDIALQQILSDDIKANFMGQELKLGKTISEFLSGLFISTVKLFINPIIFLTITLGIVQMGDLKKVGKLGAKALLYFEVVTTFALLIGVVVASIIRPGDGVNTEGVKGDISKYTKSAADFSWLKFLQDNSTLQVLIGAIIFGIIMSKYAGRQARHCFQIPFQRSAQSDAVCPDWCLRWHGVHDWQIRHSHFIAFNETHGNGLYHYGDFCLSYFMGYFAHV